LAEKPDVPSAQLMDAARWLRGTDVQPLRNHPLALRLALRAKELAKGKDLGALEIWRSVVDERR
jgi:hypothetical protein